MKSFSQIRISKEISDLIHIYCKINDVKVYDFVNDVLRKRLRVFSEKIGRV